MVQVVTILKAGSNDFKSQSFKPSLGLLHSSCQLRNIKKLTDVIASATKSVDLGSIPSLSHTKDFQKGIHSFPA